MDEDAAWYGNRPRPRPHCTRRGPSSRERGTAAPVFSAHVYCSHGRPSQLLLISCFCFFSFLSAKFRCLCTASFSDDCTDGNETVLTSGEGYLAMFPRRPSVVDDQVTASCPWILSAETGRRFNVTWRLASSSSFAVASSLYDGNNFRLHTPQPLASCPR